MVEHRSSYCHFVRFEVGARDLGSLAEPRAPETALLSLSLGSAVLVFVVAIGGGRGAAADISVVRLVAKDPEGDEHEEAADDADAEYADHDKIAAAVLVRARDRVRRPSGVQSVRSCDTSQVAQARDERSRGSDSDFAMALLENFVGPGHAVWHSWAESESHDQEPSIPCPLVARWGKSDNKKTGDLDQGCTSKEKGAEFVESIGNGSDDEDCDEIHLCLLVIPTICKQEFEDGVNLRSR
jgi:hypothetical protein